MTSTGKANNVDSSIRDSASNKCEADDCTANESETMGKIVARKRRKAMEWPSELNNSHHILKKDESEGKWILCLPCSAKGSGTGRTDIVYKRGGLIKKNWACVNCKQYPFLSSAWNHHLESQTHIQCAESFFNKKERLSQTMIIVHFCPMVSMASSEATIGDGSSCEQNSQKAVAAKNLSCMGLFRDALKELLKTGVQMMAKYSSFSCSRNYKPVMYGGHTEIMVVSNCSKMGVL